MIQIIEGVKITTNLSDLTREESQRYVDYVRAHVKDPLIELDIRESSDGGVDLNWVTRGEPFHRLRRITGYLTSDLRTWTFVLGPSYLDLRTWNNAKQAEERERVKHDIGAG